MDESARTEYPAMLAALQPSQAAHTLNERVRRINKVNTEIADWLVERRRVEEQYVQGMRKLMLFKVPNAQSELSVFQSPWDRILKSVESTAQAHQAFADRLERDVEQPLRHFPTRRESQSMTTMASNLGAMARELDDATDKSDKMQRRAGRTNPQKLEAAFSRLDAAQSAWDSQAPFILESLQALDELRVDHLRDVLTQMFTHEADTATKKSEIVADVLAGLLEVQTADEVKSYVARATSGKARSERRGVAPPRAPTATSLGAAGVGANSSEGRISSAAPSFSVPNPGTGGPGAGGSHGDDDISDASMREDTPNNSVFRRLGTVLGRRRQSVHGGFGQLSSGFTRQINSSHGREGRVSPRASSHNLSDPNRLSSLAETPDTPTESEHPNPSSSHDEVNGAGATLAPSAESFPPRSSSAGVGNINGRVDPSIFDAVPPSQPSNDQPSEGTKDAEGFTIPPQANDPISQAEREASGNAADEMMDSMFKVSIQSTPLAEEDPEEKRAALSNVATTLSQMALPLPSRKAGTVRGRRDVRNTMYVPPSAAPLATATSASLFDSDAGSNNPFALAPPPTMAAASSTMSSFMSAARSPSLAALASETSAAGTSDTQSVRSANSLGSSMAHMQHPHLAGPGLNASVIETVSATFANGEVQTVGILGEIAFSYGATGSGSPNTHETIRINNFANLGSIGPNRICVHNTPAPDQWTLDTAHFTRAPTAAFSYRVFSESLSAAASPVSPGFIDAPSNLVRHVPLIIKPVWKPDGDKIGLLLQYGPNAACTLPGPVTLHNVVLVASYLGGKGARAQTKPGGTHLGDKGLVYWRLGDLTVDAATGMGEGKIVCRVFGADSTAELRPGHVEARWEFAPVAVEAGAAPTALASGISVSRLLEKEGDEAGGASDDAKDSDPFADDNLNSPALPPPEGKQWADVPLARTLVSGKYEVRALGATERGVSGQGVPRTPVMGSPASPTIPASA